MKSLCLIFLMFVSIGNGCEESEVYPNQLYPQVLISTSMGDILIELNRNRAPITVNNFLKYVKAGLYIKTVFHRVDKDYVIQGGGYDAKFNEISNCGKIFNESGNGLRNKSGTIAMARHDDPHSATSQFYFNLSESESLDPNLKRWGYTVFGEVIEGMETLEAMNKVNTGFSDTLQSENVPIEPITIKSMKVK
jgi:peptidyl-prolyl cis-trans isomerase A (cyclophilin A)